MKRIMTAAALLLGSFTTAAATIPDPNSREGDLACVALVELGAAGARASDKPVAQVVAAMDAARWFFVGRVSKAEPAGTEREAKQAMDRLSLEEKNTVANACLKGASASLDEFLK